MLMPLLLVLAAAQATVQARSPVSVGQIAFEPADLSISYELVVPRGTTYYKTQFIWRFSDGTAVDQVAEYEWFFTNAFASVAAVVPINPLSAQTIVPSTPERPGHFTKQLKMPLPGGPVLIGADVFVIASILSDGSAFGDPATVWQVFAKRRALKREYDYWLRVDSAIATLRKIVPLLQHPRLDALGEQVRLTIKPAAESMHHGSEQDLSQAPRRLTALIGVIQQEADLLTTQSGR